MSALNVVGLDMQENKFVKRERKSRYIDATKLEELCEIMADKCDGIGESIWKQFRTVVEWSPTADVVEVVRCEDCKHKQGSACDYSAVWVRPNGYCQWGERREDGESN